MVKLYDAIKASYKPTDRLGKHGNYIKDTSLSNDNQQVYNNKKKNKLLYTVAGTHNLKDVGTDAYLAAGKLKDTNRYKEAVSTLEKAKAKYKPRKVNVAGHSLGGAIAGYLPADKITTLDKGATIGQSIAKNEKAYRTSGDAVSLLNSTSKGMKTLANPNPKIHIGNPLLDVGFNALQAHNVSNVKGQPIFV